MILDVASAQFVPHGSVFVLPHIRLLSNKRSKCLFCSFLYISSLATSCTKPHTATAASGMSCCAAYGTSYSVLDHEVSAGSDEPKSNNATECTGETKLIAARARLHAASITSKGLCAMQNVLHMERHALTRVSEMVQRTYTNRSPASGFAVGFIDRKWIKQILLSHADV